MLRRLLALTLTMAALPLLAAAPAAEADDETGVIVVHAAGDRDPTTGAPIPLAEVVVRAYADAALTDPRGACTTDASGSCTITGLAPGTYRVAPAEAPPGGPFEVLGPVVTSPGVVGPPTDTVEVGEGDATTRPLVLRRADPPLPARCGVRVTLLYDLSGSISSSEAATMKAASHGFVDALAGTPAAVAVASFATLAPAAGNENLPPTAVDTPAGVAAVKVAIDGLTGPTGTDRYTNWDAAFRAVVGQSDVVVLFTDGSPTVHGVPAVHPPVTTGFAQLDAGVLSANAVKAAGARVLAVGVGDLFALARENLAAVSGPIEGVDHAVTTFADVPAVFRGLADDLCPTAPAPTPVPVPVTPRFTG